MTFTAKGNNVILDLDLSDKVSPGGITIPRSPGDHPNFGVVVSVGEGKYYGTTLVPIPLSPGQKVFFDKSAAKGVFIDGENYVCLDASGILAVDDE